MIFLASPYTHKLPEVEDMRAQCAQVAVHWFLHVAEAFAYSPIAHFHPGRKMLGIDGSYAPYEKASHSAMEVSDHFCVLCIHGWDQSRGVKEERAFWRSLTTRRYLDIGGNLEVRFLGVEVEEPRGVRVVTEKDLGLIQTVDPDTLAYAMKREIDTCE